MFKRILLSLALVGGFIQAAEDATTVVGQGLEVVSKLTPEVQQIVDEFRVALEAGSKASRGAYVGACSKLWELRNAESLPISESENLNALNHLLDALSVKYGEERALYWASVRSFVYDMFNPYTYADAVQKMWKTDSCKDAAQLLWTEYKPVVAGAAVLITTVATGLFVAHKKGWFKKADNKQNEQNDNA